MANAWTGGIYVLLAVPQFAAGPVMAPAAILASLLLGAVLVSLSVIDFETFRLPDALTLPLIAAGLILSVLLAWEPPLLWRAAAAACGYALIWGVNEAYRALRGRAGMGLGDAKLFAAAGAWLGFEGLPSTLLYACAGALLFVAVQRLMGRHMKSQDALSFGPFLAAGIWLVWLYGPLV
jgi:leader peptidase (prepilin peptidase)/N-methyltransferase